MWREHYENFTGIMDCAGPFEQLKNQFDLYDKILRMGKGAQQRKFF